MGLTVAANKDWAGFVSRIADGDDEVEIDAEGLRDALVYDLVYALVDVWFDALVDALFNILWAFGRVGRDIDADFRHGTDREHIHAMRIGPGGIRVEAISAKGAGKSLGHLAATRIARAQKEDVWKCGVHRGFSV